MDADNGRLRTDFENHYNLRGPEIDLIQDLIDGRSDGKPCLLPDNKLFLYEVSNNGPAVKAWLSLVSICWMKSGQAMNIRILYVFSP